MIPHPKKTRAKSKAYLDFIRSKSCCVCLRAAEPHHLVTRGAGGSDFMTVPLDRVCHTNWHLWGEQKFAEKTGVNLWKEAVELILEFYEAK